MVSNVKELVIFMKDNPKVTTKQKLPQFDGRKAISTQSKVSRDNFSLGGAMRNGGLLLRLTL